MSPQPVVHFHESTSPGREGNVYRVLAWHGQFECDCPARVECKHIKAQREADLEDLAYLKEIRAMNTIEERGLVPHQAQPPAVFQPSRAVALVTAEDMETLKSIAATVMNAGAGMVPDTIKTPEAALAVMLAGREMGVPPFRALDLIYPVNGKMKMMTELMVALVEQRDPTARFVYHAIGFDGADIELFRKGTSRIRVTYTDAERKRARLGMKQLGGASAREWIPVKVKGVVQKYPDKLPNGNPHPKAGKTVYEKNPDYDPSQTSWVEDLDSNWYMYPADHFTWMALKRCIRFGASDLVNLTPMEMSFFEEDDIPLGESSRAVFGTGLTGLGEADERRNDDSEDEEWPEYDDDGIPPDDGAPPIDLSPAEGAPVGRESPPSPGENGSGQDSSGSAPTEEPGVTDVTMDLAGKRQLLETLMNDCKATWGGQDFAALQADMGQFMAGGRGIFNPRAVPEDTADAAIKFLRIKRGEPA